MPISFTADSPEDRAFRLEVRAWLADTLPDRLRGLSTRPRFEDAQWWYGKLAERGWAALHWPREWGGAEAGPDRQIVLREELARAGAPEISSQGLNHIGPILMRFGSAAQKRRHLPKILSGEVTWCQGYSEPGAGSDLAGLATRAVPEGAEFVVTGRKIWTTWAHHAQWMFLLARTDPDAPRKQAGIGFLLVDLSSAGITVRPIRTIAGDDEFAEVLLDGVRVPRGNLVGGVGDGWRIANALLAHERLGTASPAACYDALRRVRAVARANGAIDDAAFRDRLAGAEIEVAGLAAAHARAAALARAGQALGADAAVLKIVATETLQKVVDLLYETAGAEAAVSGRIETPDGPVEVAAMMLQCRRATIYGGTSEIMRDIVARRVLGLPADGARG